MEPVSFEEAAKLWKANRFRSYIPTRIGALDKMLGGGLPVRQITTLGAYTGMRKSELARQISRNAMMGGYPVINIDIELGPERLFERFYVQEAKIAREALAKEHYATHEEEHAAEDAYDTVVANKLYSIYAPGNMPPLKELLDTLDSKLASRKVGTPTLVIFDSLQRLSLGERMSDLRENMILFMGKMEVFARSNNVAVLAISEGGRPSKGKNPHKHMKISDFKESSSIEYVSDVAIVLNATQEERPEGEESFEIDVGKNRNGDQGTVPGVIVFTRPHWGMYFETEEQHAKTKRAPTAAAALGKILSYIQDIRTFSNFQVAGDLKMRKSVVCNAVRQLVKQEKVEPYGKKWRYIGDSISKKPSERSEQTEKSGQC
jgi:replicative DNA helicase